MLLSSLKDKITVLFRPEVPGTCATLAVGSPAGSERAGMAFTKMGAKPDET